MSCVVPYCEGLGEPHHVKSQGAGGKDEGNLLPICAIHHTMGHTRGWQTFQREHGLNLFALARLLWEAWKKPMPEMRSYPE